MSDLREAFPHDKALIEALRLELLHNGYTPLPNVDKRCHLKGWPTVDVTPDVIAHWSRLRAFQATGLRLDNGLIMIDIDFDLPQGVMYELFDAMTAACPTLEGALCRTGSGTKEAWFLRCDEVFTRIASPVFLHASDPDTGHRVEVFGGGSKRQAGAFGWHTKGEKLYGWVEEQSGTTYSPQTVALRDLPVVSKADVFALVDAVTRWAEAQDTLSVLQTDDVGETDATRLYDLHDDMVFDTQHEGEMSYAELAERLTMATPAMYLSASFIDGPIAKNVRRCIATTDHAGELTIWDSMTQASHLHESLVPEDSQKLVARVSDRVAQLREAHGMSPAPAPEDRMLREDGEELPFARARELVASRVYIAGSDRPVMHMHSTDMSSGLRWANFARLEERHMVTLTNPETGRKGLVRSSELWMRAPERVAVAAAVVRPAKDFPLYRDELDGMLYKNLFRPPQFADMGGDLGLFFEYIEGLLPDPDERAWFMDWWSFKMRNLEVAGPGIILVAEEFGTGRGTLKELNSAMLGAQYVHAIPFKTFAGRTYQSQYNDWSLSAIFAHVDEGRASAKESYGDGDELYEFLKELVDPAVTRRMVTRKGEPNIFAPVFTSFIIATQHHDAIPLPEKDRRFAVLTNGAPQSQSFWEAMGAWRGDARNIGALWKYLTVDHVAKTGYTPYATPPTFEGKTLMVRASRTELDEVLDDTLETIAERVGPRTPITIELVQHIGQARWRDIIKPGFKRPLARMLRARGWLPRYLEDGKTPMRIRVTFGGVPGARATGGERQTVYETREVTAEREQAEKDGKVVGQNDAGWIAAKVWEAGASRLAGMRAAGGASARPEADES